MRKPRPILVALLSQLFAGVLTGAVLLVFSRIFDVRASAWGAALIQGTFAAILSRLFKQPQWWIPIHLGFAPALLLLQSIDIPRWVYLVLFFLLLLLNWNSFKDQVPLYLTGRRMNQKLQEILKGKRSPFSFIDLGCGFAGTLCYLSKHFPESSFYGVETAPLVFIAAWIRSLPYRNCKVRFKNIWNTPLAPYDFVYCFLSPVPMPELWKKAKTEMKPGTIFMSNTFSIPGVKPDGLIELKDWRDSKLMFWNIQRK